MIEIYKIQLIEKLVEGRYISSLRRLMELLTNINITLGSPNIHVCGAGHNIICSFEDLSNQKRNREKSNHGMACEKDSCVPMSIDKHSIAQNEDHNECSKESVPYRVCLKESFVCYQSFDVEVPHRGFA
jgi:hypothetical protein